MLLAMIVLGCAVSCGCGTSAPATISYGIRVSPRVIATTPPSILAADRASDSHFGEWDDSHVDFACFGKVTTKEITSGDEKHLEVLFTDDTGRQRRVDVLLSCPKCFYENRVTVRKGVPEGFCNN